MPEAIVTLWDRPDIALANLVSGDFGGAGRALVSPDTLAPVQREKLLEKFGITQDTGAVKYVLDTTTNPTVWLGAFLTAKYEPPGTRQFFQRMASQEREFKPFIPFLDHISSFQGIFKNTDLPSLLFEVGGRTHDFKAEGADLIGKALLNFQNQTGRPVSAGEELRLGFYNTEQSGYLRKSLAVYGKKLEKARDAGLVPQSMIDEYHAARKSLPAITLSPEEQTLNKGLQDFYGWAYQKTGADLVDGPAQAVKRRFKNEAVDVGGELEAYHPLFERKLDQRWSPELAQKLQNVYTDLKLGGGQKVAGLKMAESGIVLKPSEWTRLTERYTMAEATPQGIEVGTPEFFKGLKNYIETYISEMGGGPTTKVASGTHLERLYGMVPDPVDLHEMGGPFERLGKSLAAINDRLDQHAEVAFRTGAGDLTQAASVMEYYAKAARMDAVGAATTYNNVRGRDYGWSVTPEGGDKPLGVLIDKAGADLQHVDPLRHSIYLDTYKPAAMGIPTYKEYKQAAMWDSGRVAASGLLGTDAMLGKALDQAGASGLRESLQKAIADSPNLSFRAVNSELANYFYSATLGAPNIIAPIKNLFQTLITTVPKWGWTKTVQGIKEATTQFSDYVDNRFTKGMGHEDAFRASFSDFARSEFTMDEGLLKALDQTQASLLRESTPIKQAVAKLRQVGMSLFATTETWNRAVAWNTAKIDAWGNIVDAAKEGRPIPNPFVEGGETLLPKAASEVFEHPAAQLVARNLAEQGVAETQFGAGILNTPYAMAELPQLLRQLSQFPLRFLDFARNIGPGGWGRILLGTGAAIGLGAAILGEPGKKLAYEGTAFGAFPGLTEDQPFSPFPLVPPIAQIPGAIASDLVSGEYKQIPRALPTLLPGGVGLARIAPTFSENAGKLLNRSWVDGNGKTADGRYPMYTADDALVGYYSPAGLFAKSLGLGDATAMQEQALTAWMTKFGPRVGDIKKRYFEAMSANDTREMDSIEEEYKAMNPGLGVMPIKQSQIRAFHLRRDVSRVERSLETLPPEARSQFINTAAIAFGNSGPAFLGLEPGAFEGNQTISARDPYRLAPMTSVQVPGQYGDSAGQMQSRGEQFASQFAGNSSLLSGFGPGSR